MNSLLPDSFQKIPWLDYSRRSSDNISRLSWTPKARVPIQKSPLPSRSIIQVNPFNTLQTSISFNVILPSKFSPPLFVQGGPTASEKEPHFKLRKRLCGIRENPELTYLLLGKRVHQLQCMQPGRFAWRCLFLARSCVSGGDAHRDTGCLLQEVAPFLHVQLPFLQSVWYIAFYLFNLRYCTILNSQLRK